MKLKQVLHETLDSLAVDCGAFVGGLKGSAPALLLASIGNPLLAIPRDDYQAEVLASDIRFYQTLFPGGRVEVLLSPEEPVSVARFARVIDEQAAIQKIVASPEAAALPSADDEETGRCVIRIRQDMSIPREELLSGVRAAGYREVSVVGQGGEYSFRNWILDIFPLISEHPVRIEFFGDAVESIREFDVETQRSLRHLDWTIVYPAVSSCILGSGTSFAERAAGSRRLFDIDGAFRSQGGGLEVTTLSFLSTDERAAFFAFSGIGVLPQERASIEDAVRVLSRMKEEVLIVLPNKYQAKRIMELFSKENTFASVVAPSEIDGYGGRVAIIEGNLSEGLRAPGLVILTPWELFGKEPVLARKIPEVGEKFLDRLEDIGVDDYVVHSEHGIGRFKGLSRHRAGGVDLEVALLEYGDNSLLYVPLHYIDKVHKFRAEEGFVPTLDRLGGKTWNKKKSRVKRKIDLIVSRLVDLYAEREVTKGRACTGDTEVHREFDSFFPYEETVDQLRVINEISRDMESDVPMDRLLCGDVGFGKTEVAMRAAFKAVYDGRQVAVVVPTTILCEQHVRNFRERFAAFPVAIDYLSRFKSARQVGQTLDRVRRGEIDIVIGTTALLRKDIDFHDLGLLIVDEEHRFGVSQKERIKELKKGVHCLMMSATPIPRTLQMSLSGIRTMSVIETPPEERLAVRTFVGRFEEAVIKEAVTREVSRGGQVFFVHNRIGDIEKISTYLRELLPGVQVVSAHGKMDARQLEDIMIGFMQHAYDVLLSTSIIASGIDIPSANTIIVDRADRFGLADLYQLKGRVGRGGVRANAYFLVDPAVAMTEQGRRRLRAIEQLSYLGAGLKLALKDLEIRGAGTLFGYEQSGHIHEVGFDLYLEMLKKEVADLRGLPAEEPTEAEIEIAAEAFIPRDYVEDEAVRLSLYRRMAALRSGDALEDFREEMRDRFGTEPVEVSRLFDIVSLRIAAGRLNVRKLVLSDTTLSVEFRDDSKISRDRMLGLAGSYEGTRYRENGFEYRIRSADVAKAADVARQMLSEIER